MDLHHFSINNMLNIIALSNSIKNIKEKMNEKKDSVVYPDPKGHRNKGQSKIYGQFQNL